LADVSGRVNKLADAILEDVPHRHLAQLEERLWVLSWPIGIPAYDFAFERYFACRHPIYPPASLWCIARLGPFADYPAVFEALQGQGISLIHTPDEHRRADDLRVWYPLLHDLTPQSLWFEGEPDIERIGDELGWPVFVKGSRQTSGHRKRLAMAAGPAELQRLLKEAETDALLGSQSLVFRRFAPLRLLPSSVESPHPERLPGAFEFRTFWWRGELAGVGPYWWQDEPYQLDGSARIEALSLARKAAQRLDVPFLVIDVAQTAEGKWIVVECNDGQESGFAGVPAVAMWSAVLANVPPTEPTEPPRA
jgi:hypothetical protein